LQQRNPVCVWGNSAIRRSVSHEGNAGRTQRGDIIMLNQQ
jgi:hypothetical protein